MLVQEFRLMAIENNYVINELYNEIIHRFKKSIEHEYIGISNEFINLKILNEDSQKLHTVDSKILKVLERYFKTEGFENVSIIHTSDYFCFEVTLCI